MRWDESPKFLLIASGAAAALSAALGLAAIWDHAGYNVAAAALALLTALLGWRAYERSTHRRLGRLQREHLVLPAAVADRVPRGRRAESRGGQLRPGAPGRLRRGRVAGSRRLPCPAGERCQHRALRRGPGRQLSLRGGAAPAPDPQRVRDVCGEVDQPEAHPSQGARAAGRAPANPVGGPMDNKTPLAGKRILLLEDDSDARESMVIDRKSVV